jgi:hypothetical protein
LTIHIALKTSLRLRITKISIGTLLNTYGLVKSETPSCHLLYIVNRSFFWALFQTLTMIEIRLIEVTKKTLVISGTKARPA